jgi:aminobenzoyl-glutamate utilization protein B
MKNYLPILILILSIGSINAQSVNKLKKELLNSIEQKSDELITMSDNIWHAAEVAFREEKSAEYLIEYAKQNGFDVDSDLAGMPTAFTATYGEGSPVIGIIGEFDALPGYLRQMFLIKRNLQREVQAMDVVITFLGQLA